VTEQAVPFHRKIRFLARAESHRPGTSRVDVVATHMSVVFLTDRHVYKMKKPIRSEDFDFGTLEARRRNGLEEVRLNRRLAPTVYLGVVPLALGRGGRLVLDGDGEPVEWLVRMKRLPAEGMLDRILERGRPDEAVLRPAAELLAAFHCDAPPLAPEEAPDFRHRVQATAEELCDPAFGLPGDAVRALAADQLDFLERRGFLLDERAEGGRIVEGHGDLRPEHVHVGPPPAVIDCLEFNRRLRCLDPADDLSFLGLECERLGNAAAGVFFLEVYRAVSGDHPPEEVLGFYRSFRALIRAKLAIRHLRDEAEASHARWHARALAYLALSRRHLPRG
jgi:uncharacterized protein